MPKSLLFVLFRYERDPNAWLYLRNGLKYIGDIWEDVNPPKVDRIELLTELKSKYCLRWHTVNWIYHEIVLITVGIGALKVGYP